MGPQQPISPKLICTTRRPRLHRIARLDQNICRRPITAGPAPTNCHSQIKRERPCIQPASLSRGRTPCRSPTSLTSVPSLGPANHPLCSPLEPLSALGAIDIGDPAPYSASCPARMPPTPRGHGADCRRLSFSRRRDWKCYHVVIPAARPGRSFETKCGKALTDASRCHV